jgi:hypothetical protein
MLSNKLMGGGGMDRVHVSVASKTWSLEEKWLDIFK